MSLPNEEDRLRRLERVGRGRRQIKLDTDPSEADKLTRQVLMHQPKLDERIARALVERMLEQAA